MLSRFTPTGYLFGQEMDVMFGQEMDVILTQSGHYALPINHNRRMLNQLGDGTPKITLNFVSVDPEDRHKVALKLHSQFSHPPAKTLIKLVTSAGMGNDKELIRQISIVSDQCAICKEYKKPNKLSMTTG